MRIKKVLASILCVIMVFSVIPVVQNNQVHAQTTTVPTGYKGIYTLMDLYAIRNDLDGKYILMNDLDMTEATAAGGDLDCGNGWAPIQNFNGEFNGNGHRIIGMNIFGTLSPDFYTPSGTGGVYYCGLFGSCESASIYNLMIKDCNIDIEGVEDTRGNANEEHYLAVGSIAADVDYLEAFYSCVATGNISISLKNTEWLYCGGLIGFAYCDEEEYYIHDVYNGCKITCDIEGYSSYSCCYIGGIVGEMHNRWYQNEIVVNSYNVGNIETNIAVAEGYIGALCGYNEGAYRNQCVNCYFLKGTAEYGFGSSSNQGCTPLNDFLMKSQQAYTDLDFDNMWVVDPYCAYQYPQLIDNRQLRITSLDIVQLPDKVIFYQGDDMDVTGGVLEITYEDEAKVQLPITIDMLSGYDMNSIGKHNVTVNCYGATTSYEIEVKEIPLTEIKLDKTEVSLNRYHSLQLIPIFEPENATYKDVVWSSSDTSIATVDASGVVTGKNKGDVIITATSSNDLIVTCVVHVLIPSVSISLNKTAATLKPGDVLKLEANLLPLNTTDTVMWKSNKPEVAFVENGTVIVNKVGTAKITAYTESGISSVCTITVKQTKVIDPVQEEIKRVKSIKTKISSIKNVKKKTLQLKLGDLNKCTGFQIQYSTNKKFTSAKQVNKKSTNVKITKLKKNKTYYVRVRVYKVIGGKKYYGKWSAIKSKKITK